MFYKILVLTAFATFSVFGMEQSDTLREEYSISNIDISSNCYKLLQCFEGVECKFYRDSERYLTMGVGHLLEKNKDKVEFTDLLGKEIWQVIASSAYPKKLESVPEELKGITFKPSFVKNLYEDNINGEGWGVAETID
ncbi:MAG: hypothetical protein ACTSXG_04220 [Alphaproteobacteria bacterium]